LIGSGGGFFSTTGSGSGSGVGSGGFKWAQDDNITAIAIATKAASNRVLAGFRGSLDFIDDPDTWGKIIFYRSPRVAANM
jgi:hypothetical protein